MNYTELLPNCSTCMCTAGSTASVGTSIGSTGLMLYRTAGTQQYHAYAVQHWEVQARTVQHKAVHILGDAALLTFNAEDFSIRKSSNEGKQQLKWL